MRFPLSVFEEGPGVPLRGDPGSHFQTLRWAHGPGTRGPGVPGRRVLVPLLHHVKICENFERFQYFNFETDFLENENLFQNTGVSFFS